ncbi:MAG: DUF4160 domain-containing protein [Selenomonadaceae bacterium]|nr:DUF4160 domain-containing protein [Selenomonadaceae bacterium]
MPKVCRIGKYIIYFGSNEGFEPIHIHVCEGVPTKDATKIWMDKWPHLAHNKSQIPPKDLNMIMQWLAANRKYVRHKWDKHFAKERDN